MSKRKDYSRFTAGVSSVKTNYRIKLTIGKDLDRSTVCDGAGLAKSKDEAVKMYDSLVRKTWGVLKSELYYEETLIKKS